MTRVPWPTGSRTRTQIQDGLALESEFLPITVGPSDASLNTHTESLLLLTFTRG